MKKDTWVICINDENFFHPDFELVEGRLYLVYDIRVTPSLLNKTNIRLVFQTETGKLVEISSKRFRRISD